MAQSSDSDDRREVALKINDQDSDNGCSRDAELGFQSGGEGFSNLRSKEVKVSFKEASSTEDVRRRHKDFSGQESSQLSSSSGEGGGAGDCDEEVLVCSGNASFWRRSSSFRSKTKSRLMDSPIEQDRRSERAIKSGVLGNAGNDDEDNDLLDEDMPEEYKRMKFSTLTVIQWVSLILIMAALVCSLTIPIVKKRTLWDLQLWKWEVMALVLICGRLVSGWGIRVVVFFIERNFLLRKQVLYFVYGLRSTVENCLWLSFVLIAWHCIFNYKVEKDIRSRVLPYVTKIIVCLLVGTSIWLLKTLIVKVLASSFHVSAFFERIQESLFNQYVIETLSGPPLIDRESLQEEEKRIVNEIQKPQSAGCTMPADLRATFRPLSSGRVTESGGLEKSPKVGTSPRLSRAMPKKQDEEITIDHLHKLNQNNISAWNMKRLMNIVRHAALYTLDEQILNSDIEDESLLQIRSERQARKAAKKIFRNVAKMGSKFIYLVDLLCFMREDEALKTMCLFEGATEGEGISKASLKNWMVNAFRERRALALSLTDTNTAVDEFHRMLSILVGIVIVIIWLLIIGIEITHFLVLVSSQLLVVVFVFGNTCKTIFEAIIFLFVMHPFDVGDRCEVDGVQMVVEEMNILTTVFLRYDNQKIIYPNSVLAAKSISNYYRSPDMGDAIDFCIHVLTPIEKIAIMKERIKGYIEGKNDHWYPSPMIVMKDVVDMNRLNMSVWVTHRMNYQDMGERWVRRALLVEEMIKVFRELDIEYRMLALDVNVRQIPGLTSNRLPSIWTSCAS